MSASPRSFVAPDDVDALASEKLALSGLDARHAKVLGIRPLTTAETLAAVPHAWPVPSLKLLYFDLDGAPLRTVGEQFFRLRALRVPEPKLKTFRKYLQPPDVGAAPYFPQIAGVDWRAVARDPAQPLVITEGELKAAKATLEGFPTIGLGGVDSFTSRQLGQTFLRHLEEVVWRDRVVTVAYDSDAADNPHVCAAADRLADVICDRGALPRVLFVPPVDGLEKTGLDDWFVAHPAAEFHDLLAAAAPVSLAAPLRALSRKYVYVTTLRRVVWRAEGNLMTGAELRELETARFAERRVLPGGRVSNESVSAAEKWLTWSLRPNVRRITYRPGAAALDVVEDDEADGAFAFNIWRGWATEPRKGDVGPFLKLVDHQFTGASDASRTWFLRWLAYPLQHPGAKLATSVVFYGRQQGTGKSSIGYTMKRIYGANFREITQSDFHTPFNEWAAERQFVMGDDVSGSDKRTDLDRMKKMITQEEVRVNAKNQPAFFIPDVINYFWTSNRADAFALEDADRRFFIHELAGEPLPDAFFERYYRQLKEGALGAAIFYYLLDLDLGDFSPHARALSTEAKERMTRESGSEVLNWARDVLAHPDETLMIGGASIPGDLLTSRQLMTAFAAWTGKPETSVTSTALGRALTSVGVRQVNGGRPVRTGPRSIDRYYAVRNAGKWMRAGPDALAKHITEAESGKKNRKF